MMREGQEGQACCVVEKEFETQSSKCSIEDVVAEFVSQRETIRAVPLETQEVE